MSTASVSLDGLVGEIYDAAFDPSLWPTTLEHVADAVGGAQVMMGIHDFANGALQVIAPRMDPEHFASYRDHWWTGDQLWQRTNAAPVNHVLHAERFVSRWELERSAFYSEWYRRLHLGAAGLGANLVVDGGVPAMCGIKRARHRGDFTATQINAFGMLVPHLSRAARLHRHAWDLHLREGLLNAGVEHRAAAVFVTDARGQLAHMNAQAQDLLRGGSGFCTRRGLLCAEHPRSAAALARCLAATRSGPSLDGAVRDDSFEVQRAQGRPLRVRVLAFPSRAVQLHDGWSAAALPTAIVVVRDPEAERRARMEALQTRFQLTPAEATLALEIVRGKGRQAAADRIGISPGTVRFQLQRVFEKTGVHRQAELVRLVEGL